MFNAMTFDNVITKNEIDLILNFAMSKTDWEKTSDNGFWSNRSLTAQRIYKENEDIGKLLYDIKDRIKNKIVSKMTNGKDVFPDLFQIIRWFPGQELNPHWDDMKNIGDEYEAFYHRDFGSVLYLNDNYDGGYTYYPKEDIYVIPKSGMLAVHPGDSDHLHGVTKIEGGIRYTIASFWTYDKEYDFEWSK